MIKGTITMIMNDTNTDMPSRNPIVFKIRYDDRNIIAENKIRARRGKCLARSRIEIQIEVKIKMKTT